MVYLDYAASSVPFPEAAQEQQRVMLTQYGNPGALHRGAAGPRKTLQEARKTLAALLKVRPEEIFFTSGGTEANNWAVKLGCSGQKRHIVVSGAEHKSVLEPAMAMAGQGYEVTLVYPGTDGLIAQETVAAALRRDTGLLCIQAVNNETGVMQDVAALADLARKNGTRFLCDGVQSFGHCDQPLHRADLISLSAHKLGGPRGWAVWWFATPIPLARCSTAEGRNSAAAPERRMCPASLVLPWRPGWRRKSGSRNTSV